MKRNSWKFIALLLAGAMTVSLMLTSCTAFMKEPALETVSTGGAPLPSVSGFMKNDSINAKLAEEFSSVAGRMQQLADDSDGRLRVEYSLDQTGSGLFGGKYRVTMTLTDGNESIQLKSGEISGMDKVESSGDDGEWLASADLAEAVLYMKRLGVEIASDTLDVKSTEKNAVDVFLRLYENVTRREPDISLVKVGNDDFLKKSFLLGYIDYYGSDEYYFSETANVYRVAELAAKAMTVIERDAFGRQSETVTGSEFIAILKTLHTAMRVHEQEQAKGLWSDLGTFISQDVLDKMELTGDPFDRRDAAELLGRITKNGPKYSMKYGDRNLERVVDATDSIWVRRAITHGFMNYYGDSNIFAPWEGLTVVSAIPNAKTYLCTRYNDWAYSGDYAWDGDLTNGDVYISALKIADYFSGRPEEERNFNVHTVINDRDYNWFFSQRNTGEFSSINCMPTIATMASHWYNQASTVTPEEMRKRGGGTDAWTAYELRYALAASDVPYLVEDATLENIYKALDEGKIILAQYSDRKTGYDGVPGHCYVIYGYRRFRNSGTLIVNDSDSLSYRAQIFGREQGNGDEIDASFSIWSISRFVDDVSVIG